MSEDSLDAHTRAIVERVVEEEAAKRTHLVVALSGAHAYGFPSPDSDVDLKGVHVDATERLLGLSPWLTQAERQQIIDGVEIDYSSNEIQAVLAGVLKGNGNYIERVLGALLVHSSPELGGLAEVVRGALSRRVHRHYHGFATGMVRELTKSDSPRAKQVLYALRTALTGAHLLRTGLVVTDVGALAGEYGLGAMASELIAVKAAGERAPLAPGVRERWPGAVSRAFAALDDAVAGSVLPAEPRNRAEVEAWLVSLRRTRLGS